jgi:hypothetical protein
MTSEPPDTGESHEDKPKVQLVGMDGNAYSILGRCHGAAMKFGWSKERWREFSDKAKSGDYDNLLRTVMEEFDEEEDEDDE